MMTTSKTANSIVSVDHSLSSSTIDMDYQYPPQRLGSEARKTVSVLISRSEARLLCSDTTPRHVFFADDSNPAISSGNCTHHSNVTVVSRNCQLCVKEPIRTCHHGKNFFFNQQLADTLLSYDEIVIFDCGEAAVAFRDFLKEKDVFAGKDITIRRILGIL